MSVMYCDHCHKYIDIDLKDECMDLENVPTGQCNIFDQHEGTKDEIYDCPIHGKLGETTCPRC